MYVERNEIIILIMIEKFNTNKIWTDLTVLTVFFGIFFLLGIGDRNFSTPDEGRYVEIPREMVVSNDFVTPRLNGLKYFEKPPLFYWVEASVIKVFGLSELSTRSVVAVIALIGCLLTYIFGNTFFGRLSGLFGSIH